MKNRPVRVAACMGSFTAMRMNSKDRTGEMKIRLLTLAAEEESCRPFNQKKNARLISKIPIYSTPASPCHDGKTIRFNTIERIRV